MALALLILSAYQPRVYAQEFELKLSLAPSILPADGSRHEAIVVQLLSGGEPFPAPEEMNVSLVSSNPIVGKPDDFVILKKGAYYAIAGFTTTKNVGETNLTAAVGGVISNTATLKVSPVAGVPDHIEIKTIPNEFELFGNEYGYLVVELEDGLGRPAMADHDIEVEITVEPEIASIPKRLVIRKGESYSFAKFEIGGIEGTAKLTALTDEYGEASATLTVAAREASKLSVYVLPSEVTSGSTVYVFAQLLD
ncbi:MAG: hypothetical protein J7K45_01530, partial [Thaumarchaeota archaeon]|nr:hypothetical protein [Nitrososphaerota archaeon]